MALKDITITGSINSYPTLSYGQKTYIASTDEQSFPIEHITGSAGGSTPDFNGRVATTNLFVNITQSWEYNVDSPLGNIVETQDTEEEFINGEYSGSAIQVTDQRLIDEDCVQYLTPSTVPTNFKLYFYSTPTFPLGKIPLNSPRYEDYLKAKAYRDNFLNPNTSPNPGEIYILTTVSEKFGVPPVLPPQGKLFRNYSRWINGTEHKWNQLSSLDGDKSEDKLTLVLQEVKINGILQPLPPIFQIQVLTPSQPPPAPPYNNIYSKNEVIYRDDGYGMVPVNYIDYINYIFGYYGLSSRIIGINPALPSASSSEFLINFFKDEDFTFLFKENGQVYGDPLPTLIYGVGTYQGDIYQISYPDKFPYPLESGYMWEPYIPQ